MEVPDLKNQATEITEETEVARPSDRARRGQADPVRERALFSVLFVGFSASFLRSGISVPSKSPCAAKSEDESHYTAELIRYDPRRFWRNGTSAGARVRPPAPCVRRARFRPGVSARESILIDPH
jgi:hypothetical protein